MKHLPLQTTPRVIGTLLFTLLLSLQLFPQTVPPLLAEMKVHTEKQRKAVVLFSYRQGWWAVEDEIKGINQGLAAMGYEEKKNIEITRIYMNTKTQNNTDYLMEDAAVTILERISKEAPDILLIMDDDALRHVGAKLLDTPLPIVFGGINLLVTDPNYGWITRSKRSPLANSLEQPGHNITGVLERIAIKSGFNLLHQILPTAQTALFISDNSSLSKQLLLAADAEKVFSNLPLTIVKQVFTNSYEKMQQTVLEHQEKVDSIVIFLPWTFEDKNGEHIPSKKVVNWLLQHNRRPGIAYLDILAQEGFLCGVVVDMVQQGFHAGILAGRILNGESPQNIPIIDPVANRIVVNLARAKQLDIDIPFEVLKNSDVIHKSMTSFPASGQ